MKKKQSIRQKSKNVGSKTRPNKMTKDLTRKMKQTIHFNTD